MKKTKTSSKKVSPKAQVDTEKKQEKFPLPFLSYKTFKDVQEAVKKREVAFGVRPQALMKLARCHVMGPGMTFLCNFLLGPVVFVFAIACICAAVYTGINWLYFAPVPAILGNVLISPYSKKNFSVIGTFVMIISACMGWNLAVIMAGIFTLFGVLAIIARVICQIKIETVVLEDEALFIALWNDSEICLLHYDNNQTMENLRIGNFLMQAIKEQKIYNKKDENAKKEIDAIVQCDKWKIQYNVERDMYKKGVFETYYISKVEFFFAALGIVLLCKSFYVWGIISILAYIYTTDKNRNAVARNLYYGKNTFTKYTYARTLADMK